MKLVQLYRDILEALGFEVSQEGHVSTVVYHNEGRELMPTLVDGERLVIPTDHMLSIDNREFIIFHPMYEDPYKGPTVVSEFLRKAISVRLDNAIAMLLVKIFTLATSVEDQKHIKPEQIELLDLAKNANERTLENVVKLISATSSSDRERAFTHLYAKRGGELNGVKYSQVGVMSFPIYEALKAAESTRKVFGVQLRVADYNNVLQVLEYILPDIGTPNAYSFGSESIVAPRLEAMMGAFYNVYNRIAHIEGLFNLTSDTLPDYVNAQPFPMAWTTFVGRTHQYQTEVSRIPQQRGGEQKDDANQASFNSANQALKTAQALPVHEIPQPHQPVTGAQPHQLHTPPAPAHQPQAQVVPAHQLQAPVAQAPVAQPQQQPASGGGNINDAVSSSLGLMAHMNNPFNSTIGNVTPVQQQQLMQHQVNAIPGIGTFNVPTSPQAIPQMGMQPGLMLPGQMAPQMGMVMGQPGMMSMQPMQGMYPGQGMPMQPVQPMQGMQPMPGMAPSQPVIGGYFR